MTKKLFSFCLALILAFGCLPMSASAVEGEDWLTVPGIEGGRIQFDKETGAITDCEVTVTTANIPSAIDGVAVTGIGDYAFYGCTSLTSITIPDGVTSIGNCAFYNCNSLASVAIPDSVIWIGDSAFSDCSGLTAIEVAPGNSAYCSVDGVLFSKDRTKLLEYPFGKRDTAYEIPNGVTKIGEKAFNFSTNLASVTIPNSVTSIADSAFGGCSSLKAIQVAENNSSYTSQNGVLFNKELTTLLRYPAGKTDTQYTIPNNVTSIGDYAFSDCSGLTSITIPDSVTSIGVAVFRACSSLTSVTIPDSVTSIGGAVFRECTGLTSITIPASVTSIGSYAFFFCTGLTSVTIPNSVTSIGDSAFWYCSSLTGVTFEGNVPTLGNGAFRACANNFCIYYYAKNHGWSTPTWEGYPSSPIGTKPDTPDRPPSPSVPSDDDPIVEMDTTEDGNTATTTTQPNGDQELKVETSTGETIANIKLPADPGKGKEFADVKSGAWYEGAVDKATAYGLFGGTSDTTFAPDNNMTRGMLAQVLYNLSGRTNYGLGEGTFTDVKNGAWYRDAVDWAAKVGVTPGTGNGGFSPNQSITREQLVTMLYNYAKAIGTDTAESTSLNHFPDGGEVHDWAETAMEWAVAKGFINGREEGSKNYIAPQGTATRAEVAVILSKFVESLK